jgi:catechol 2,3-dioxygenase-like lactoylglutathione lyase family enzyme
MALINTLISGIQQVGIGVRNADEAFDWYRIHFGMDVPVFKDASVAELMLPYTGGKPWERYAILALNMQGGGGFEIWQYTGREPQAAEFQVQVGDLGIFGIMMKCRNVKVANERLKNMKLLVSDIYQAPDRSLRFHMNDKYGNRFTFCEGISWFSKGNHSNGGVSGVQIGVSDMERSMHFYSQILGLDEVVYDQTGVFGELGAEELRRVLLRPSVKPGGAFSRLLGVPQIELVQLSAGGGRKIYDNRFWGDLGYIHVCFDVNDMQALEARCSEKGYPFTVNSGNSFDMGEAAGQFAYNADPDGTLIEYVQTHKLPIMKKLGWYLDLRKRDHNKPLPDWMLATMKFSRVKG